MPTTVAAVFLPAYLFGGTEPLPDAVNNTSSPLKRQHALDVVEQPPVKRRRHTSALPQALTPPAYAERTPPSAAGAVAGLASSQTVFESVLQAALAAAHAALQTGQPSQAMAHYTRVLAYVPGLCLPHTGRKTWQTDVVQQHIQATVQLLRGLAALQLCQLCTAWDDLRGALQQLQALSKVYLHPHAVLRQLVAPHSALYKQLLQLLLWPDKLYFIHLVRAAMLSCGALAELSWREFAYAGLVRADLFLPAYMQARLYCQALTLGKALCSTTQKLLAEQCAAALQHALSCRTQPEDYCAGLQLYASLLHLTQPCDTAAGLRHLEFCCAEACQQDTQHTVFKTTWHSLRQQHLALQTRRQPT